jgi:simple sugar transport system ATP-binding protein
MTSSILELRNIRKEYGSKIALDGLDLTVNKNEVLGLLGDNGAGKSTLIKVMSGILPITSGEVFSDGKAVPLNSRHDSQEIGIETIYQDVALVPTMSIMRNMFLGREIVDKFGFLKQDEMRKISMEVLKSAVHISGINSPDMPVGRLSGGQAQAVAIARAVHFKSRLLLLDEPTSALSVRETEWVLDYVRKLKSEGTSSVLVTHNLYHAYQVCDRFIVMSHGKKSIEVRREDTTIEELTEHVIKV